MSTRPPITAANYQPTLLSLWSHAFLIEEQPLDEMLARAERATIAGPLLDPTLYREKGAALYEDIEMLRALLHVQATLASIRRRRAGR